MGLNLTQFKLSELREVQSLLHILLLQIAQLKRTSLTMQEMKLFKKAINLTAKVDSSISS